MGNRIYLYLILSLLLISSTQVRFMVKGISISRMLEAATVVRGEEKTSVTSRIGSRPPSCEGRCSSCVHCEAVQMPAVPHKKKTLNKDSSIKSIFNSRGEYTSNYKPMNWKCKCGDMIFNP